MSQSPVPADSSPLTQVVPLLEEACRYARQHGVEAQVEVAAGQAGLSIAAPGSGIREYLLFSLQGDDGQIEKRYAGKDTLRQPITAEALCATVIETELAGFFQRAAALPLEYLRQRHPAGFW